MTDNWLTLKDVPTTAPVLEPITLADLKLDLGATGSALDTPLTNNILSARKSVEGYLRRQLMTATWTGYLDRFPSGDTIYVPLPPLQSITSIYYIDSDGDSQLWDAGSYAVDIASGPGRITLAYGESWPDTREQANAVTIVFVAGFGATAASVPEDITHALRLQVERDSMPVSEYREHTLNRSIQALLAPWRILRGG
jgi:uncharacterized phiE125 gp8 family phage protein